MANLPEIIVKPELLRWARESTGIALDKVARTLRIPRAEVEKWEITASSIRLTQLEKLSEIYKRPLAAFFLPTPPSEPPLPKDYRKLPDSEGLSPTSRLAIRRARRLRSIAVELSESLKVEGKAQIPQISNTSHPEEVAVTAREALGIGIEEQLGWSDSRQALGEWRAAIEKRGVLAFQLPMPIKEIRGFSISERTYPVVVISSKDSVNGRIFSLLHEYAHILLHNGGLCDMQNDTILPSGFQIEHFCNWFAAATLVPRRDFLNQPSVVALRDTRVADDEVLADLSATFKVSQDVILRRLLTVGVISESHYSRRAKELEEAFKNLPKRKTKGGAPPAARAVQESGVPLTAMVLSAYRSENISSKEVSDFLGVRQKHLPKVENILTNKAKLYG